MMVKQLLLRVLVLLLSLERRIFGEWFRFGLGINLRRAYWESRLRSLGEGTGISANVVIRRPGSVTIGSNCAIAEFVHIWGGGEVAIGDRVLIASHVAITSMSHDPDGPIFLDTSTKGRVRIGDNVWIGAGSIILPGIEIGSGSVVAAGAVVTQDVPPNCMVAGTPAKVKRHLAS